MTELLDIAELGFRWFDTTDQIDSGLRQSAISAIDKILETFPQQPSRPSFQTGTDLFSLPEFRVFKESFVSACLTLMPPSKKSFKLDLPCSSYMDYWDNYRLKDRDAQWHFHEGALFSGIYYLLIPESMDLAVCGTEFRDPDIYLQPRQGHWLIFPGRTLHRPGISNTNDKRYVLAADFKPLFTH